jgi:hypothetical protein
MVRAYNYRRPLVLAEAGTQFVARRSVWLWIPDFAGMSGEGPA